MHKEKVLKICNDYVELTSEAKIRLLKGKKIKMLTLSKYFKDCQWHLHK